MLTKSENNTKNYCSIKKSERQVLFHIIFLLSSLKCFRKDGKAWVYHTYQQLSDELLISKSTVIRAINGLLRKGIIEKAYLSNNKKNRTTYYCVNHSVMNEYMEDKPGKGAKEKPRAHVIKKARVSKMTTSKKGRNDNIIYYNYNYKSINLINPMISNTIIKIEISPFLLTPYAQKAEKGAPPKEESLEKTQATEEVVREKPHIVQDMLKIWKREIPNNTFTLTKQLAQYLVAAFKMKFDSCLEKWKMYLRLLKTSDFINSDKFRINISWCLKFSTIDRIKDGWLGVNPDRIIRHDPMETEEEIKANIKANISEKEKIETPEALNLRRDLIRDFGERTYLNWFADSDIKWTKEGWVILVENTFLSDYIRRLIDNLGANSLLRSVRVATAENYNGILRNVNTLNVSYS